MLNTKRPSFGPYPAQNASLLLEKTKANIRRSTPDSEALASSDDDQDQTPRSFNMPTHQPTQPSKPTRRPSWLSDSYTTAHHKSSTGSLDAMATTGQHPVSTSSMDTASTWATPSPPASRGHTGTASLPWNSTIWGNDSSKVLPSRFAEVLPSPTTIPTTSAGHVEPGLKTASPRRDSGSDAAIPFQIPLQPTLKTYRSQSYSVGQMEQEANAAPGNGRGGQYAYNHRGRGGSSFAGLHHRQGRPSLYDFPGDNLGLLQEVEDDEESATSSDGGARYATSQARTIEQLAMENALLRQQALANQTASFSAPFGAGTNPIPRANMRGFQLSDSVLEEPDDQSLGEEDLRSSNHSSLSGLGQHRYNGSTEGMRNASPETFGNAGTSRSPASFKRGHWHSSGNFGNFGDGSQSRRHSFADVPRRTLSGTPQDMGNMNPDSARARAGFADTALPQTEAPPYMANTPPRFDAARTASAHGLPTALNPVARPQISHFGQPPPHLPQHLYLVTFKAARAEFYYVQEGTGLDVNEGDLVIVEADRGTDLGTVAHKNIDWSIARELKEHYVQEHFNWLMMFSRQGQTGASTTGRPSSAGQPGGKSGLLSSLGGSGPAGAPETSTAEIKPKLIKRLAQTHEVHTLREKEGNEAKAKRMCQQKVAEHRLNMEILDAEFQMDWKKLTFYYFADAYINFNSLVTDLFKIYKTRIWMSAINPASFVSRNPALPPIAGASSTFGMREHQPQHPHPGPAAYDQRGRTDNNGGTGGFMVPEAPSYETGGWFAPNSAFSAMPAGANPYAQYWASAQNMPPVGTGQMPGAGGRQQSASPAMARYGPEGGEHGMPINYADQLQSLQGLSLGN